jgi:AcrR family transcriptional regulator
MSKEKDNEKEIQDSILFDESLSEDELTKRQKQILEAAIKIFSEKGFDKSKTSEIAKEAKVAEGTIFRYYKTKKDLLLGLLLPMVTKFFRPLIFRSVEKIMDNENNENIEIVLNKLVSDRVELAQKNAPLVKTIALESFTQPELLKPIKEEIIPQFVPIIDNFMKQNIDKGIFRDLDPRFITRSLMSMVIGYIMLTNTFPDTFTKENDDKEIEKIINLFLNGVKIKEGSDKNE